MWIKLNPISGLIFVIYPQEMLVSAKKKPWMFEIFSIVIVPPIQGCHKFDIFGNSNKKGTPMTQMGARGK